MPDQDLTPTVGEPHEYMVMEEVLDDIAKAVVMHADKWNWAHDDFVRMIEDRVKERTA